MGITEGLRPNFVKKAIVGGITGTVSKVFGLAQGPGGDASSRVEFQVIPNAGTSALSVTLEHSLDPTRGFKVIATIAAAGGDVVTVEVAGGYLRVTCGTITGGTVDVLLAVK